MSYAIRIEKLSKRYRINHKRDRAAYRTIRESLTDMLAAPWRRLRHGVSNQPEDFWALNDVSFDVQPGEVVGFIGRNGAGKSTLLKILSRITKPTRGRAILRGRVASLLEVGTGFHAELTGRENIYLNGAILGMTRHEIRAKFDEIVAFAEVGRFLDTPVKRYSSGMYVRLAFAIAAHLDPEILIVDEVLAVGDAEFQAKCLGKMSEVAHAGRTILFVSHNMQAVSSLCSRVIYLDRGSVHRDSEASVAVSDYLQQTAIGERSAWVGEDGDQDLALLLCELKTASSDGVYRTDHELTLRAKFRTHQPIHGLICAVEVYNKSGAKLAYSCFDDALAPPSDVTPPATHVWELAIPPNTFAAGDYTFKVDFGIHNVRRLSTDRSQLTIHIENIDGIGRRYLAHTDVVRPNWKWRRIENKN